MYKKYILYSAIVTVSALFLFILFRLLANISIFLMFPIGILATIFFIRMYVVSRDEDKYKGTVSYDIEKIIDKHINKGDENVKT